MDSQIIESYAPSYKQWLGITCFRRNNYFNLSVTQVSSHWI